MDDFSAQNILRNIFDGVIVIDTSGRIKMVNDAVCFLLGYVEDELLDQPVSMIFDKENPFEEKNPDGTLFRRYLNPEERACRTKTRQVIPTLFSSSALLGDEGDIRGIVCVLQDITERKKIEENLRKTQAQLYQSAKMEMIGRLAAGAAHEVKNPLAILLQGIDFLSNGIKADIPELPPVVSLMKDAVIRADSVIKGLLDFAGASVLKPAPENMNELIQRSLLLVNNSVVKKHAKVIRGLQEDLVPAVIDRNKIQQVLINLFMNAVDAMPTGGELLVRTRMKSSDVVLVEVENTGPSIPPDVLANIFEPFTTTKRGSGGTGLGLSIVKSIMDLHKGIIHFENREEGGVRASLMFSAENKSVQEESVKEKSLA